MSCEAAPVEEVPAVVTELWLLVSVGAEGGTNTVNVLVISALEVESDDDAVDVEDDDTVCVEGSEALDVVDPPERVRLLLDVELETEEVEEVPGKEDISDEL